MFQQSTLFQQFFINQPVALNWIALARTWENVSTGAVTSVLTPKPELNKKILHAGRYFFTVIADNHFK